MLVVESEIERPWPFAVDVDGNLVFDLDEQRVLANFDLHIPNKLWAKGLPAHLPHIAPPGDLVFSLEAVRQKSFSFPLRVATDSRGQRVLIEFMNIGFDSVVGLSDACIGLVLGHELAGFVVTLPTQQR